MLLLSIIVALELIIVSPRAVPRFDRAYAWVRLVKVWASLRFDCTRGIVPGFMKLDERCLTIKIVRSKTTGPGKKVEVRWVYVSVDAYLVDPRWLTVGFELWKSEGFAFDRDYLVPLPSRRRDRAREAEATYAEASAMSWALFGELRAPRWHEEYEHGGAQLPGHWVESDRSLFSVNWVYFWTEHSDRNWLSSMAAV